MNADEAMSRLGRFGRWQMIRYAMVCLSVTVSGCWHMMVIVFTGGEPDHHCKVPDGQLINETIPMVKSGRRMVYEQCKKYVNYSLGNDTMACDEGWYYEPEFDSTIVTEWDLVCDKNYLMETSQSVFNFGVMVGAVVFTSLADRIGRRPVHLGCQYTMLVVGLALVFAPNYVTFVILRFILGAIREGAGLVGIVMACELFPAAQRTFAGTALELFWAAAYMMLALIAYLVTNWRHLQLAITIPPMLTIGLYWFLPESVPWLVANNQIDKAEVILRQAAKVNKVVLPERILERHENQLQSDSQNGDAAYRALGDATVHEDSSAVSDDVSKSPNKTLDAVKDETSKMLPRSPRKCRTQPKAKMLGCFQGLCKKKENANIDSLGTQYTCLDIIRSKIMLLNTFVMCSLWFASGIIYFGLSLSTSALAGNKYINFFLSGAVEAPAYGLTVFLLPRYGRRWPLCIFHLVAAIVLFINIFLPEETESGLNLVPLIVTLTMIGKFAMTASFGTVVLYAPEIYPTNLRNLGFGLASVWGRIGGTIAPFSTYIGKIVPWVPGLVFSVVAVITAAMALILPETQNRPLPETIPEIENWKRSGGVKDARLDTSKQNCNLQFKKKLLVRGSNCAPGRNESQV